MIIASLKKKNSNVIVIFDDGSFITLDYRSVIDFGLRKGDRLSEEKQNEIAVASTLLKARDSALRYISRRMHSPFELRLKLQRKLYPTDIISRVIEELIQKNLLDENEFVKDYAAERIHRKKIGTNKLKLELMKKGINRKLVDSVKNEINSEEYFDNLMVIARKKLEQILRKENDTHKIRGKLFNHLLQRGYESELIHKALQILVNEEE